MSTLPSSASGAKDTRPLWQRYVPGHHWRTQDIEFDACKLGIWLFLSTEILLFSGLFCAYAIFRLLYPAAFANGSQYLDVGIGATNTVVLLFSSWTIAMAIREIQLDNRMRSIMYLVITWLCAAFFVGVKLIFEYIPKLSEGKAPGHHFSYPWAAEAHEPIWWSIYYMATGVHASHVIIGMGLIAWVIYRTAKGAYGPTHFTMMEGVGLYWHIVDLVWIVLFPLLYLIH